MLRLHTLKKKKGSTTKEKRLGRGAGSGTGDTSTTGHKGLRARKSGNARAGYEGGQTPLYRRIPKRGFRNIFSKEYIVINVGDLERFGMTEVNLEALRKARKVSGKETLLKVLGDGDVKLALNVKADKFSKSAVEKIEKAGGKVEVLNGSR
jgi:large subunit ribosomal protein L15